MGAGQEHQDVTGIRHGHRLTANGGHLLPDRNFARRASTAVVHRRSIRPIEHVHRIDPPAGLERGGGREEIRESRGFQRRGHHHDAQVRARAVLQVQTTGECDVHRQTAFVELVENHRADAW